MTGRVSGLLAKPAAAIPNIRQFSGHLG